MCLIEVPYSSNEYWSYYHVCVYFLSFFYSYRNDIYYQSIDSFFTLMIVPFTVKQLISLMQSHLFIYTDFHCLYFGVISMESLWRTMSWRFSLIFTSRSFRDFNLKFRFLIHFWVNYCVCVKHGSNFIVLIMDIHFLCSISWRYYSWWPCWISVDHICVWIDLRTLNFISLV